MPTWARLLLLAIVYGLELLVATVGLHDKPSAALLFVGAIGLPCFLAAFYLPILVIRAIYPSFTKRSFRLLGWPLALFLACALGFLLLVLRRFAVELASMSLRL